MSTTATSEHPFQIKDGTLGSLLRGGPLRIPNYQREYSWKKRRVAKLFDDFSAAMDAGQTNYFLGIVVLDPSNNIIDGQQRLATTCILLAAIRDELLRLQEDGEAGSIYQDFLNMYDRETKENVPRIVLNNDDREYMKSRILSNPKDRRPMIARMNSHKRLRIAAKVAYRRVRNISDSAQTVSRKVDALNRWVTFIDKRALVAKMIAPSSAKAYQLFKTLNDRGQRTTQADMIKCHLFEQASSIDEAQSKWTATRTTIEGLQLGAEPLMAYLHHVCIVINGATPAERIFDILEQKITGKSKALTFLDTLATLASYYAAILNVNSSHWAQYDRKVMRSVRSISELQLVFLRPLMMAVMARFDKQQLEKAMPLLATWAVRFVIAGGHTTGTVNKVFGDAAQAVYDRKIRKAAKLFEAVKDVIPSNSEFHSAFCSKAIANERLARWFLDELEQEVRKNSNESLLTPTQDTTIISLEHVLPKNPEADGWGHFSKDERRFFRNRLGNLALLRTKDNNDLGDVPFAIKRPVIAKSNYINLTKDIVDRTSGDPAVWAKEHIDERQKSLAKLALKRWPI